MSTKSRNRHQQPRRSTRGRPPAPAPETSATGSAADPTPHQVSETMWVNAAPMLLPQSPPPVVDEVVVALDPESPWGRRREDPLPPDATVTGPADPDQDEDPRPHRRALFGRVASEARETTGDSTDSSPAAAPLGNPLEARAKSAAFGQLAGAAFAAISGLLHIRLRVDEADETWLADQDEVEAVGQPLGRIAARHAPLPGGTDASDLGDAVEATIALTAYLIRCSGQRARLIRHRRRDRAAQQQDG